MRKSSRKPSTVVRRIERRMTINHINVRHDYEKCLERHPRECSILYRGFLIGVTRFSRNKAAFDFMAKARSVWIKRGQSFPNEHDEKIHS
jgi:chemotaxis methyl-accepting protein methylase